MNSTSLATANGTPNQDKNGRPHDVGGSVHQLTLGPAPVPRQRPTISLLRDAMNAFNIRGTCRLVGFELLSYWQPGGAVFPSLRTLSAGLGVEPRTVRAHLARLSRVGLWVRVARTGRTNLYELRLPGPEPRILGSPPPDPTIPHEVTKEVDVQPPQAAPKTH